MRMAGLCAGALATGWAGVPVERQSTFAPFEFATVRVLTSLLAQHI